MKDDRAIADYSRAEFDALRSRLMDARDTLLAGNRPLQSVARAYYVVYVTASYAAGEHGVKVTHRRDGAKIVDQKFSHSEFVDVVWALYTGNKRGNVQDPGGSPGPTSAHYEGTQAYRQANDLYLVRIEADYGPTASAEPYARTEVDAMLKIAQNLTEDLERLL
jgi:hypothetical protein